MTYIAAGGSILIKLINAKEFSHTFRAQKRQFYGNICTIHVAGYK